MNDRLFVIRFPEEMDIYCPICGKAVNRLYVRASDNEAARNYFVTRQAVCADCLHIFDTEEVWVSKAEIDKFKTFGKNGK